MLNLRHLTIIGLLMVFSISSCTVNKTTRSQANEVHGLHAGKYAHCSLCHLEVAQWKEVDQPEQIASKSERIAGPITWNDRGLDMGDTLKFKKEMASDTVTEKVLIIAGDTTKTDSVNTEAKPINRRNIKTFNSGENEVEPLGKTGLLVALIGIVVFISGIIGSLFLIILGLLILLLAFIFGVISLKRIRRKPKKYQNKRYAIASTILGGLALLPLLGLLLWMLG